MARISTWSLAIVGALALLGGAAFAQDKPTYNPRETFAPLTLPGPINSYRSGNGAPGPDYWQNRADYEIHATISVETESQAQYLPNRSRISSPWPRPVTRPRRRVSS